MITLGEGSRLTGLGKTTLARAIKAGRPSATRTTTGSYEIDPAELARCYRFKAPTEATDATVAATGPARPPGATGATAVLEAQVAGHGRSVICFGDSSTRCGRIANGGDRTRGNQRRPTARCFLRRDGSSRVMNRRRLPTGE
jgi:hypothetical protein